MGWERTIAWCWERTVSCGTLRLAGRGPCRSTHTEAGVDIMTATVCIPWRFAAATSGALASRVTFVAFPVKLLCAGMLGRRGPWCGRGGRTRCPSG